jgi:phosphate starvation-inducible PhoH-like protein
MQKVRQSREATKADRGRQVKEKFVEAREEGRTQRQDTKPLVPRNDKQRDYIRAINEHALVIATGFAGTSKTYIPTVMACDAYLRGEIDKIVFTRPNVSNSPSVGMFKGSAIEKMEMWLMPVINILRDRLTPGGLECAIENGNIQYMPLEVIKGFSAENCFFIVDEGEDISVEEAKKIVTRQGKNCKMVISGDVSQSELKERSGLKMLTSMVQRHSNLDCGFIDFNHVNDIERSEATKQWIVAFCRDEREANAASAE